MLDLHPRDQSERTVDAVVDLTGFVKSLRIPPGVIIPRGMQYEDIRASALDRSDLADDVARVNSSIELIKRTRGGGWPAEPLTDELDYVDLVWHEAEFREGYSFAYVARHRDGGYIGCCYFYPLGRRTALTEELIVHDVDVSWWVTTEAYESGYYERLYAALRHWLAEDLPFTSPHFSNREIPTQQER
jgi:hypothetical protein